MKNTIIVLLIIFGFVACKESKSKDKISLAKGLLGNWENKSIDGTLTESWTKINDSTYRGSSCFIKNKDTLHFEVITLQQNAKKLTYQSITRGHNNDNPVTFNFIVSDEKQLMFENLKQDYPQKIIYKQLSENNLIVEISGVQQGKSSTERYAMIKLK
jgi:hypothetical protein